MDILTRIYVFVYTLHRKNVAKRVSIHILINNKNTGKLSGVIQL
jgi:hypothetical protein